MSITSTIPMPLTRGANGYVSFPPPVWIDEQFGLHHRTSATRRHGERQSIRVARAKDAALVSVQIDGAMSLDAAALEKAVVHAYSAVREELNRIGVRHPVRMWNYIPGINERMPDGRDRYMVFNAGRFEAFSAWYGGPQAFDRAVPTATGVGHPGEDLVIHCLATENDGTAVANPRQVQPFHYSQRFGPVPPCFARATHVAGTPPMVLVGGTASIRGEDSLHVLDFAGQMGETLANLAAMVHAAAGRTAASFRAGDLSLLKRYKELRVYLPDVKQARFIHQIVTKSFPTLGRLEMLHADLCRPELLVEIEGIAELPQTGEE